jgi:hypothetical protein
MNETLARSSFGLRGGIALEASNNVALDGHKFNDSA